MEIKFCKNGLVQKGNLLIHKHLVYHTDIYKKNNSCISCVFNGFKYMLKMTGKKIFTIEGWKILFI